MRITGLGHYFRLHLTLNVALTFFGVRGWGEFWVPGVSITSATLTDVGMVKLVATDIVIKTSTEIPATSPKGLF